VHELGEGAAQVEEGLARQPEHLGDVGRCGEMWGDVGRCGER
jgi:hypothetical protein